MLNSLARMARQIKLGLVLKVFAVYVIFSSLVSIYYVYYAMPKFQSLYIQEAREKNQEGVEVALGVLSSYHSLEEEGILTTGEAQAHALSAPLRQPSALPGLRRPPRPCRYPKAPGTA